MNGAPITLLMYALLLMAGQVVFYGADPITDAVDTLAIEGPDGTLDRWSEFILTVMLFPVTLFVALVKLSLLTSVTGLPILIKLILGVPALVGLLWNTALFLGKLLEGIGALIPFT